MTPDPLATFVELLERTAPDVARRLRPAPEDRVAELAAIAPKLPPEYLRFLALAGGNRLGELAPFMTDDAFDVDHAIASYAPEEVIEYDDEEVAAYNRPVVIPDGWVFLCERFHHSHKFPAYRQYLAPVTTDGPPDPEGRVRVAMGYVDEAGTTHDLAHRGTLEELLIDWLFLLRFPDPYGQLTFYRNPEDECEAGEYFIDVMHDAGFRTIAGARPHDWFTLLEHTDGSWVWLQRYPADLEKYGRYTVFTRAPNPERHGEIDTFIDRELDCE